RYSSIATKRGLWSLQEFVANDRSSLIDAGSNSGTATITRNTHNNNKAAIVPSPPMAITPVAMRSVHRTSGEVFRVRVRPLNDLFDGMTRIIRRIVGDDGAAATHLFQPRVRRAQPLAGYSHHARAA